MQNSGEHNDDYLSLDNLFAIYATERASSASIVSSMVALVALSLTYYTITIAYAATKPEIISQHPDSLFVFPLIPAAMFSWLLLFTIVENGRRYYLAGIEEEISKHSEQVRFSNVNMKVPYFSSLEGRVWTVAIKPYSRLPLAALCVVLDATLYIAYGIYIVLIYLLARTYLSIAECLWLLFYAAHFIISLLALIPSARTPETYFPGLIKSAQKE
jgi:hypothetical protein